MKNLLKNRIFWIIVIILVFGFSTGFFKDLFRPENTYARLELNLEKERRAFEGKVEEDTTILNALIAASIGGNFEVNYVILNDETKVYKIDGVSAGMKNLNFYLNNSKVETKEIHKIKIKPGDKILVKYE